MTNEIVFTKLSCGCEWSPVAGLKMACDQGEDKHQEFIKEAMKKAEKK